MGGDRLRLNPPWSARVWSHFGPTLDSETVETATAIVAIYAALVATGSLGWQVYFWWHRRQARVEVSAAVGIAATGLGTAEVVTVTAVNRSEFPVNVKSVGFDTQDGSGRTLALLHPNPGSTLPGRIEPQDSGMAVSPKNQLEDNGLDLTKPVTAWVRLSTDDLVRSKPPPLLSP